MIVRSFHVRRIQDLFRIFRAVAIIGPRQVGKTTLARQVMAAWRGPTRRFDLESPRDLELLDDPMLALGRLKGLVVIDEVQRRPELFPVLRVLADRVPLPAKFLILGSAAPGLLKQASESLLGRISYYDLQGFTGAETGFRQHERLWLRGGFPKSLLARSDSDSFGWREGFVQTFLERDLPNLGISTPSVTLRRFWTMLAHVHGGMWNSSEFARTFGVADTTVRRYLDILTGSFVVRQLLPWHENISKRQVKAPKIYIADSGLLHVLLGIKTLDDLENHPRAGASWEGFAMSELMTHLRAGSHEFSFWRAHTGAELDLLVVRGTRRYGFEFQRADAPRLTPSMRSALADLKLDSLDVIYPGDETWPMAPKVRAVGLSRIFKDIKPLR